MKRKRQAMPPYLTKHVVTKAVEVLLENTNNNSESQLVL